MTVGFTKVQLSQRNCLCNKLRGFTFRSDQMWYVCRAGTNNSTRLGVGCSRCTPVQASRTAEKAKRGQPMHHPLRWLGWACPETTRQALVSMTTHCKPAACQVQLCAAVRQPHRWQICQEGRARAFGETLGFGSGMGFRGLGLIGSCVWPLAMRGLQIHKLTWQ